MACSERSIRNLGDPFTSSDLPIGGRTVQRKKAVRWVIKRRESDHLIVLRDGKAVHMGKGMTGLRSPQRKLVPDMKGWTMQANLTEGNSKESMFLLVFLYEASNSEEPCAGIPHAGICEGAVG